MQAVLALLTRAIGILLDILGTVTGIQALLGGTAQESQPLYIQHRLDQLFSHVDSSIAGFPWVHSAITQAVSDINGHIDAALDGLVVNFPSEAPAWYTAPENLANTAYYVWNWPTSRNTLDASETTVYALGALEDIWSYVSARTGWQGIPLPKNQYVSRVDWQPYRESDSHLTWRGYYENAGDYPPVPDFSLVLSTDTPYTFLARTQPTYGWTSTDPAGNTTETAWKQIEGSGGNSQSAYIRSNFTRLEMLALASGSVDLSAITDKLDSIQPSDAYNLSTLTSGVGGVDANVTTILADLLALTDEGTVTLQMILDAIGALQSAREGAPVWPGIDNVTLGTPAALTGQLHLEETMDGVIIAITTPPTRTGQYLVGGAPLDYGQGRIAFETDNGDIEPWQYIGFRTAIYTPKSMAHAAGVRVQALAGAEGTVTPWVVST